MWRPAWLEQRWEARACRAGGKQSSLASTKSERGHRGRVLSRGVTRCASSDIKLDRNSGGKETSLAGVEMVLGSGYGASTRVGAGGGL